MAYIQPLIPPSPSLTHLKNVHLRVQTDGYTHTQTHMHASKQTPYKEMMNLHIVLYRMKTKYCWNTSTHIRQTLKLIKNNNMKYRLKSYKTQIFVKTVDINICESHSKNSVNHISRLVSKKNDFFRLR